MKQFILPVILCATTLSASASTELPPSSPTDVDATFYIRDGKGIVKGQLTAPTMSDDYLDPQPLSRISLLEVTRSCWEIGESEIPVARFEQAVPGRVYSFEDTSLEAYGHEYTYKAVARNADGEGGYGNYAFVFAGVHPMSPEYVSVTTTDNGKSPLTFTVRAEALTADGDPLGMPLTALSLSYVADDDDETSDTISTIENPESGKEYVITFDAIDDMSYTFRLVSECEFGRSESRSMSMYVGADSPAAPETINVVAKDGGAALSWTAPEKGRHNGWIDPAATRYKVERIIGYTPTVLAEDLSECEFFDPCDDLTTVTAVKYAVTAYNTIGEGEKATSETITVGPSATLPFIEHFNTVALYSVGPDNLWIYEPDDYNWSCSAYTYASGGATGVLGDEENEEGYAYCSHTYAYGDVENRIISTPIDMTSARYPVLSFWYLSVPSLDNLLTAGFRADGEEHTLVEIGISDDFNTNAQEGAEFVWVPRFVEMPEAVGKSASVVFNAIRKAEGNYGTICIDEILLDDYPPVEVFTSNFDGRNGVIAWTAPNNSTGEASSYEIELDGVQLDSLTTPELQLTDVEEKDHTLRVRAWYGDIPSCWSDSYIFNPLTTGILTTGVETGITEYYDLTGMRRNSFTPGEVLIRRTVSPDGSVKVSKVMM